MKDISGNGMPLYFLNNGLLLFAIDFNFYVFTGHLSEIIPGINFIHGQVLHVLTLAV